MDRQRPDKRMAAADAVRAFVRDGDVVCVAGFSHLIPYALGHEVIRRRRRDLPLVKHTPDLLGEQLPGRSPRDAPTMPLRSSVFLNTIARRCLLGLIPKHRGDDGAPGDSRGRSRTPSEWSGELCRAAPSGVHTQVATLGLFGEERGDDGSIKGGDP